MSGLSQRGSTRPCSYHACATCSGNLHLKEAAEALGLATRDPPHMGGTFGVWDGAKLVYKSHEFKPLTLLTMLWR